MNHFNKSGAFSSAKSVRQSVAIEGNLVYSAAVLHQQDLHRLVCAAHHVGPFCEVKPDYTPRTLTRIPVRVVIPVLAIICLICSLTTSSQTCVTGGGRTPAAVFPDELCIRLQMSHARRSL